jgi:tetratricopeptide (TPR) repeat protein
MFDQIPVRAWLLFGIAAAAYLPGRYAFRYIAASPSRRDVTQPSEDLSWRTPAQFTLNFGALCALAALAIFIFTPAAEQFARSPSFLPFLMVCLGAWSLFTVSRGLVTGQVQPFVKGFNDTYARDGQPKRFWASLAWNALFGCMCLWLAYQTNDDATKQPLRDRCFSDNNAYPPRVGIAACNDLISAGDRPGNNVSDLVRARGFAYYRLGDFSRANSDYSEAIRLNPRDSQSYLNRGLIFLDIGNFGEAAANFTQAHELDPKSPWPLANRGMAFAQEKNQTLAERDFQAVRVIDPSNPVMLRGEALLRLTAGDIRGAVDSLTASMIREPDNPWALRKRAELYWELGEQEKSAEDDKNWQQLMEKTRTTGR